MPTRASTTPFPIQAATLPDSLAGRDVLGRGRTGSGKTYAFLLPMVARLATSQTRRAPGRPRALILAPTRELVAQIDAALAPLAAATNLRSVTVFGGVGPQPQIEKLRQGVDIVIACPGRLEDHVRSGHADLSAVEITVLDEADHMADLGFLPAVKRLLDRTPRRGQRMLFSATLDGGVDVLVKRYLHDPVVHSVDSAQSPVSAMVHHVLHVDSAARINVLTDLAAAPGRTIVFARTKHGAKKLARQLNSRGVAAVELHGNLSQNARTRNLAAFSDGSAKVMVATDIAARGIHVDDVEPGGARRSAGRAQGLPAPVGAHRPRRSRRHRGDTHARRPGVRCAAADPQGRGEADDHPIQRRDRTRCCSRSPPASAHSVSRRQPRAHRKLSPRSRPAAQAQAQAEQRTLPHRRGVLGERSARLIHHIRCADRPTIRPAAGS